MFFNALGNQLLLSLPCQALDGDALLTLTCCVSLEVGPLTPLVSAACLCGVWSPLIERFLLGDHLPQVIPTTAHRDVSIADASLSKTCARLVSASCMVGDVVLLVDFVEGGIHL